MRISKFLRAGVAVCALCIPPEMCVDQMKMIKAANMTPLRPPTRINGPGSMVWVMYRGANREYIEVGLVCGVRGSLGPAFVPIESPTKREELSAAARRTYGVGIDVLEKIRLDVRFKHIASINVAFENARVMCVAEEDVYANMHNRSAACKAAIAGRLARGDQVTMVSSTLEGDLIYTVSWETGYEVEVKAQIELISDLAARLGVGEAIITRHSIASRALIWGIKDDLFLAEVSINGNIGLEVDGPRTLKRISTRVLPPGLPIDLSGPPIAPVVRSEHPDNARYTYDEPNQIRVRVRSQSLD